ncbi:LrgB family protein [Nocardioides sp. GY 10127]|uniref:LrgB family protein n=1 Tax=Nocardioides sp. GY 10127 TaxID=2569762 RepID=UPI0010A8069C|nr:LrgB family protein [Nocardioides sp. GY 10127]TIC79967.1 LrgB family protein [Nocardioides sp. GY 10127]
MTWLLDQPLTWLVATLLAYRAGCWLRDRTGRHPLAQPVLVAVAVLAAAILATGADLDVFTDGTAAVSFLLGPATVALAVPLHRQLHRLRGYVLPLLGSLVVGALVSITTAYGLVVLLGGSEELGRTMAPKATTAAVSIPLSESLGGIASLTAALTILAGILGAVAGPTVLTWLRVRDPRARGLAVGAASHGIGTARVLGEDEVAGAFSGLSMGLTALLTSLLLPLLAQLL